VPFIPAWPGVEAYQGQLVHSVRYQSGRAYAGQRVLVVGVGNSGAEIAADLAEQGAALAAISIRTPPPIVPRDFLGIPVQASRLIPRANSPLSPACSSSAMSNHTAGCCMKPTWLRKGWPASLPKAVIGKLIISQPKTG